MPKINEIHDNEIALNLFRAGLLNRDEFANGHGEYITRMVGFYRAGMDFHDDIVTTEAEARIENLETDLRDMEEERDDAKWARETAERERDQAAAALKTLAGMVRDFVEALRAGNLAANQVMSKLEEMEKAAK